MIRKLDTNDIIERYKHLHEDFPDNEIRELSNILSLLERNLYTGFGLYLGNDCIAYALLAQTNISKYLLLDYFAVKKEFRSKNYGSVLLQYIGEMQGDYCGMIAEVESIDSAINLSQRSERTRRIQFYERNHFIHTNINSVVYGVEYSLLYLPMEKVQTKEELLFGIEEIYNTLFSKRILDSHVKIILRI